MPISHHGEPRGSPVLAFLSGGAARLEEGVAESGITFRLWRLYQRFWLLCLLFPVISLVREPHAPWHLALGLFSLLFFAASYTWLTWPHPVNQRRQARARSRLSLLMLKFTQTLHTFTSSGEPSRLRRKSCTSRIQ